MNEQTNNERATFKSFDFWSETDENSTESIDKLCWFRNLHACIYVHVRHMIVYYDGVTAVVLWVLCRFVLSYLLSCVSHVEMRDFGPEHWKGTKLYWKAIWNVEVNFIDTTF